MHRTSTLAALTLVTTLTACDLGAPSADEYASVLPDDRMRVEIPGDAGLRSAAGDISEFYINTRQATLDINGGLAEILEGLDEITSFDPSWSNERENTALWGPWDNDEDTLARLWVHHGADDSYSWALEVSGRSGGSWVAVIAGEIEPGATEEQSAGRLAVDFDTIEDLGAGEGEVGTLVADYALFPDGAQVRVAFEGFGDDASGEVHDALYSYEHTRGVGGHLDLAYTQDEVGGADQELAVVRTRWDATGAGRADALLTDGDLGPLTFQASECWGEDKRVVFYEDNVDFTRSGDASLCAFEASSFPE